MKKIFAILFLLPLLCHAQNQNFKADTNGITVTGIENPSTFMEARLLLDKTLFFSQENIDTGKNTFKFEVDNYILGAQTPDAGMKLCANSSKGQHIHFILDNMPYVASYSNEITASIKPGHHVLLAFLSRSYHESIKHKKAYILQEFDAGKGKIIDTFNSGGPQLFYSRPKGEYIGLKETSKVMLDFYLINCTLSAKGYKIRATINGSSFLLAKWEPYFMEGLRPGENKVKLELLDGNGRLVKCAYNGVERTFKLSPEEPLQK